jgi:hypothetical protein
MTEPESHGEPPPPLQPPAPLQRGPLVLSDVYLLTAASGGEVAVPGLTVMFDGSGLTVRKPDGAQAAVVTWADVSGLVASKRMRTPAGHPGVIIEAATASRTHRFVVPSDNPDGLEYEVMQLATTMGAGRATSAPTPKRRSTVLTGALVVLAVAIIALGVLVATGTVKF